MSDFRVATWNVHGFCEGVDTAITTAGPFLLNVDILALQEVPRHDIPRVCNLLWKMNESSSSSSTSSYDYACQHGTAMVTRFPILDKLSQTPQINASYKKNKKGS